MIDAMTISPSTPTGPNRCDARFAQLYTQLWGIARRELGDTLALVHEAYLRLEGRSLDLSGRGQASPRRHVILPSTCCVAPWGAIHGSHASRSTKHGVEPEPSCSRSGPVQGGGES